MKYLSLYMQGCSFWCPPLRRLWRDNPKDMLKFTLVSTILNFVCIGAWYRANRKTGVGYIEYYADLGLKASEKVTEMVVR